MAGNENKQKLTLKDRFKKRVRPRRPWFVVMGIAVLLCCFLAVYAIKQLTTRDLEEDIRTTAMKSEVETVTGGNATRNYRNKIQEMNKRASEQAERQGKTYIPTVEGTDAPLKKLEEKQKETQRDLNQNREIRKESGNKNRHQVSALQDRIETLKAQMRRMQDKSRQRRDLQDKENTRQDKRRLEKIIQQYTNQMSNLESELEYSHSEQKIYVFEDIREKNTEAQKRIKDFQPKENEETDYSPEISLHPGDILYARNDLQLNSDVPSSPAQATVVGGKYRGAKLIGGFRKQRNHLLVQFDRMIMPDGREYGIKAFAIDPTIPAASVRSDIDRHMLQRWGGLIASSFLAGFGEAVSQSGSTTIQTDGSIITTHPELDIEQQTWIAGGRVGEKVGTKMERNFDRPSTVTLDAGKNIGILFLEVEKKS